MQKKALSKVPETINAIGSMRGSRLKASPRATVETLDTVVRSSTLKPWPQQKTGG